MKEFIKGIFTDENGIWSSKRLIGILGAISLIIFMFVFQTNLSVESVLILTCGAIGVTGAVSIFGKKE
jgi:hypothetical protein